MPTIRFQEIKARATRKGECSICHRRVTRSRSFMQTVSPFNKTADGQPCTPAEVRTKVVAEADAWSPPADLFTHDACLDGDTTEEGR